MSPRSYKPSFLKIKCDNSAYPSLEIALDEKFQDNLILSITLTLKKAQVSLLYWR